MLLIDMSLHQAAMALIDSPIQRYLEDLHGRVAGLREGELASYIPELARADPEWFGIAVATVDGHVYQVGDSRQTFSIQSVSKPFVYGLALADLGVERVLAKVGVEPSGEAFNSISLEPGTGRPLNLSSTPAVPPRRRSSVPAPMRPWPAPGAAAGWRSARCWPDTAPGCVSTNSRAS